MRAPVRVAWAISLLVCMVAILLMPGMASLVVRTHATGKHMVRLVGAHLQMTLASASEYRWLLRAPSVRWSSLRQVIHGFGPDLLDQTCVLRC